ncbi:MAG: FAD-dependent monooxygenase [Elusimicrobia bacterium]|nr:FAD-dependent monooxygenase [Elusimicrobiota bacterium]MBI2915396.1 FAD-dependent monooxygenase [Elusimicrobiota bacterium]
MPEEKFDTIIVGAGPAGTSAAITAARAGLSAILLERGEYPGAKNVQGGILYTKMLDEIAPGFWKEPSPPVERHITEQKVMLLTENSALHLGFKSKLWNREPHNCYSIIRVHFDRWYAKKAEEAGAQLYTGVLVTDVVRKNGRICGVKTSEGDEILADVVIACDGVNSILAQKAGLIDEWKPEEVALAVKETLALPREKIEDRFCLENGEGTTFEIFGNVTEGMLGYAFLYTNQESLSLGVGCKLSHFQKKGIPPYELLDRVKNHSILKKLIQGSQTLEYSGHLIPEGGFNSMPPLYSDGFLIAGDAAQMVNASHREGSNLAMTAGKLAAQTVIEAKKAGDFSSRTLSLYQKKLRQSYILPDLYDHKDLEDKVEARPELLTDLPDLLCQSAYEYFNVDGRPKRDVQSAILKRIFRHKGVRKIIKSELTLKNAVGLVKNAIKGALTYKS